MKTLANICKKAIQTAALWLVAALACLLAGFVPAAYAQNAKLDLSRFDKLAKKASSVKSVNLDGSMLKQVGASQLNLLGPAGEFKDMAGRLQGIYVRKYEFDKSGEYSKEDLESLLKQVHSGKWSPMVTKEDKKTGEIKGVYVMDEGGETVGMAVIKADPKELSIVNIVGPINLSSLAGLGGSHPELQHRGEPDQKANRQPTPQAEPK